MPDENGLVGDPLPSANHGDLVSKRSIIGHQHGQPDAASGGADSSPLENVSTDERHDVPGVERMSSPDVNEREKK